ncbi:hypothetical protein MNV49_007325 [Pseudohyphozyma bogoriensis]|nr:hypothetical protein MNV49_007325 [Pseudohyphozyma bogoriensis]
MDTLRFWTSTSHNTPLANPTPLAQLAAMKGQADCAQLLIDAGADIDAPDLQGNTPLHYATAWGKLPVVKLLVELDCKQPKNNEGFTAVEYSFSFAVQKALEEYTRAHYEQTKRSARTRKASNKTTRGSSPSKLGIAPPPDQNPGLGFPVSLPTSAISSGPRLHHRSSTSNSQLSSTSSTPAFTRPSSPPLATPPLSSHGIPNPTTTTPTLSPLSLKRIGRTASSTSSANPISSPPSPAVESIRKIGLRDQNAIDTFKNHSQGMARSASYATIGGESETGSVASVSGSTRPRVAGQRSASFSTGVVPGSAVARVRAERSENVGSVRAASAGGEGGSSDGAALGETGTPSELAINRSRSGSNLSTGSSGTGVTRPIPAPLAPTTKILRAPLESPPPTPPSATSKPALRTQSSQGQESPSPTPTPVKKERRLSAVVNAVLGEEAATKGRDRRGSNDSQAAGPGRFARVMGLGKKEKS